MTLPWSDCRQLRPPVAPVDRFGLAGRGSLHSRPCRGCRGCTDAVDKSASSPGRGSLRAAVALFAVRRLPDSCSLPLKLFAWPAGLSHHHFHPECLIAAGNGRLCCRAATRLDQFLAPSRRRLRSAGRGSTHETARYRYSRPADRAGARSLAGGFLAGSATGAVAGFLGWTLCPALFGELRDCTRSAHGCRGLPPAPPARVGAGQALA